ncbi:hypothetical protein [Burkholderia ubonensis]|uniref:hypothetical protein n=1 Tax=Burkholderia ubonensis TaxID=101571 RepID=UPI000AE3091E|nr:hypothetical protein [Burkholderia ubonensis]
MSVHAFQPADAQGLAIHDLGTFPGATYSSATAINNRGQVVGEPTTSSGQTHAAMWTR